MLGAMVLADGGICCIDEFDNMFQATRSVLHGMMEQHSIAKKSIICHLNACTFLLTAANPRESRWIKNKTVMENIELPRTLQSRFSLRYTADLAQEGETVDIGMLQGHIVYPRANFHLMLTDSASQCRIRPTWS